MVRSMVQAKVAVNGKYHQAERVNQEPEAGEAVGVSPERDEQPGPLCSLSLSHQRKQEGEE